MPRPEVYIDGEEVHTDDAYASDGAIESVTVILNANGDWPEATCVNCSESLAHYPTGWEHSENGGRNCFRNTTECETCEGVGAIGDLPNLTDCPAECDRGMVPTVAEPSVTPLQWCNSAGIHLSEDDDSVTVTISVGDPRGAFGFTVRKITEGENAGKLLLHVPYSGMPTPHRPLTELHTGTYLIG